MLDVAEVTIPAVRPRLNEILAQYPNSGQLSLDTIHFTTGPRWPDKNQYHVSERILISKHSEEPLVFPPLIDVGMLSLTTRRGVAPGHFAISHYDLSRTERPHLRLL